MTCNCAGEDNLARSSGAPGFDLLTLAALGAAGLLLWLWADSPGDGEAWDHDVFWSMVLPAMAALAAVAGFTRPRIALLAGVAMVVPQAIALFATKGFAPLAVVGIIFFVLFAAAFTVIALLAARLREWLGDHRAN